MRAATALAISFAAMTAAAAENVCATGAARADGMMSHCTDAGGWRFAGNNNWTATVKPDSRGRRFACEKMCDPAVTLDVEFTHGNEGINPPVPFSPESYLARWNEKGLFDLAWLDAEDEAMSTLPLGVVAREPFKAAEFRFKSGKPSVAPYERLIAITFARDQLYIFKFTSAIGGLDRNRERIVALLRSVEVSK